MELNRSSDERPEDCEAGSDETYTVRVPVTGEELLELRDDLEWGQKILGDPGLHSLAEAYGLRLWLRMAKRVLEGAERLRRRGP